MAQPASSLSELAVFGTCALVVSLYAARRYDTPETNRLTTTRALFLATLAGYVLTSLALFALLSEIVLKPGVLGFLGVEDAQKLVAGYAAPSVLAALLLTTLLPNTAVVSTADAWLLKVFQDWGRIPSGVRSLADTLDRKLLLVSDGAVAEISAWIKEEADTPDELAGYLSSSPASPSRLALTRALLLYREIERLSGEESYKGAFRSQQAEWDAVRGELRVFAAQSHAFFVLFDHLSHLEEGAETLKRARRLYDETCAKLHGHMAELLARVMLRVEAYDARIRARVRAMGFYVGREVQVSPLPVGPFVFLGSMMALGILCVVALVPTSHPGQLPLGVTALLISVTQTLALLAAILPKLRISAFQAAANGEMPYFGWLASSVAAGAASLAIERIALGLTHHDLAVVVDFGRAPLTPVGPMAALICLAVAILTDVELPFAREPARRLMEGLICGLAMAVGIFVFTQLAGLPAASRGQVGGWFPFVFSFALGFVSGIIGPHAYRGARAAQPGAAAPEGNGAVNGPHETSAILSTGVR